jgi:tetratricopeptide (TPR) repeat protein
LTQTRSTSRRALSLGGLALSFSLALACSGGKAKLTPDTPESKARRTLQEARALHERADYEGSKAKLELALAQDPKLAAAHTLLGRGALAQGDATGAKREFEKALALDPTEGEATLGLGNALVELGDLPAAEKALLDARRLSPSSARVHFYLGDLYSRAGQDEQAKPFYQEAARLDPAYVWPKLGLARLSRKSAPEEAQRLAEEAAQTAPNLDEPQHLLGLLAADQKDYPKAEERFRKAVSLNPSARNQMNLGTVLAWQGKLDEAVKAFQDAATSNGSYALAYNNLGHSLKQAGKNPEAITALEKAVSLSPQTPLYRVNLGDSLSTAGRAKDAAEQYRAALGLLPDQAAIARKLALALSSSGEPGAAYDALSTFVAAHPADPATPALQEELSRLAREELKQQLR